MGWGERPCGCCVRLSGASRAQEAPGPLQPSVLRPRQPSAVRAAREAAASRPGQPAAAAECDPQRHAHPEPQDVAVFGIRVFAAVIQDLGVSAPWTGGPSPMTASFCTEETQTRGCGREAT